GMVLSTKIPEIYYASPAVNPRHRENDRLLGGRLAGKGILVSEARGLIRGYALAIRLSNLIGRIIPGSDIHGKLQEKDRLSQVSNKARQAEDFKKAVIQVLEKSGFILSEEEEKQIGSTILNTEIMLSLNPDTGGAFCEMRDGKLIVRIAQEELNDVLMGALDSINFVHVKQLVNLISPQAEVKADIETSEGDEMAADLISLKELSKLTAGSAAVTLLGMGALLTGALPVIASLFAVTASLFTAATYGLAGITGKRVRSLGYRRSDEWKQDTSLMDIVTRHAGEGVKVVMLSSEEWLKKGLPGEGVAKAARDTIYLNEGWVLASDSGFMNFARRAVLPAVMQHEMRHISGYGEIRAYAEMPFKIIKSLFAPEVRPAAELDMRGVFDRMVSELSAGNGFLRGSEQEKAMADARLMNHGQGVISRGLFEQILKDYPRNRNFAK
ncbi:MAG TPA: hypothetical protein VJC03_06745, partial [bacterium]|nr:hypothetical protein [bacterium]